MKTPGGSGVPAASGQGWYLPCLPRLLLPSAAGSRPGRLAAFLAYHGSHAPRSIHPSADAERACAVWLFAGSFPGPETQGMGSC